MEKICSKCNKLKDIEEFNFHSPAKKDGKRRPDCKECVRKRSATYCKSHYEDQKIRMKRVKDRATKRNREYITEYLLAHPCVDCGETDVVVLDFDHVRGEKVCDISRMVACGFRLWRIKEEIEKCVVRCANDHRRRHAREEAELD
jgi:hypothetical protein